MNNSKPIALTAKQHEMLKKAATLHQSGKLPEAALQYQALLKVLPNNPMLLTSLGIIALQQGNIEKGISIINQSLQIAPNQIDALINCGIALQYLKRFDEAIACYDRVIALNPNHVAVYFNRGSSLHYLNRLDDAVASYDKAIALNPNYIEAFYNRGIVLQDLQRWHDALAGYDRVIALKPDFAEAHCNRGVVLQELKRPNDAISSYERALALKPDYAEAYSNRGIALQELNRIDEALDSHNHAIILNPGNAEAYFNRGNALKQLNRPDEALADYHRAIALNPHYAQAFLNRGNILHDLQQADNALADYNRAVALNPGYAEAYLNRGNLQHVLQHLDDALASYDQAIALNPGYAEAYWNKSLLKCLKGEYAEGWQLYEWRLKRPGLIARLRTYPQPLWLGAQSLSGKTIFIYPEQGLGDYIQFIRYATLIEELGGHAILETPAALTDIISTLKGQFTLLEPGQPLPDFDYHCPVMSLPLAFKTTLETIPATIPYLYAHKEKQKLWSEKLGEKSKPRVGMVWQGGFRADQPETWATNARRNIKLAKFACLKGLSLVFYSLQKGQPAEAELHELQSANWDGPDIVDFSSQLQDFSDTAAFIENLDLLISVDTSTAHLAAAMGKEVWILNRFDTCWRWLLDRDDSPWYPTVTLFRQTTFGHWDGVIEKVRARLIEKFEV
jgi:tetratricopeptide (TPR) repeat protein